MTQFIQGVVSDGPALLQIQAFEYCLTQSSQELFRYSKIYWGAQH